MKALVWHGKEDIRCDTVTDPKIEDPRDAIVKVTSCAMCGSDLHFFHNFIPAMMPGDIMGHEMMGRGRGNRVRRGREAEAGRSHRSPVHDHLRRVRAVPTWQLLGLRADESQEAFGGQGFRPRDSRSFRLHPSDG